MTYSSLPTECAASVQPYRPVTAVRPSPLGERGRQVDWFSIEPPTSLARSADCVGHAGGIAGVVPHAQLPENPLGRAGRAIGNRVV